MTADSTPPLRAGIAKRCITPTRPVFQSGYSRDKKSFGVYEHIYARALVVEDADGDRIAILSGELLDFSESLVNTIKAGAKQRLGLEESQVLVSATHTHCGPVVDDFIAMLYPEVDMEYVEWLGQTCIDALCDAAQDLHAVKAEFAKSRAAFAINRRRPDLEGCPMKPNLNGRWDPDVAIVKLSRDGGNALAVLFSYACHPTTMGGQFIGGDYPGQAMLSLEREFPGANAMFIAGCFGDVRPRMINAQGGFCAGNLDDVRALGRNLALAVTAGFTGDVQDITGPLYHAIETVALPFQELPTKAELLETAQNGSGNRVLWAKTLLERIESDGALSPTRPSTVQVLGMGPFRLVAFNDETCLGYQLKVKKELEPTPVLVAAYCGSSRMYVPTADLLPEGGYEALTNIYVYGQPAPLAPETEDILLSTALRLAKG